MWPLPVVVMDVGIQNLSQMAPARTSISPNLLAYRPDPPLRVVVGVGRQDGSQDDLRSVGHEHLVKWSGELRVTVVNQEAK